MNNSADSMAQAQSENPGVGLSAVRLPLIARIALGVALAALSAGIATLAFPRYEIWPLIFVAFIPMAIAQHRVLPVSWSPLAPGVTIGAYFAGQLSAGLAEGNVAWYIQLWPLYGALFIAGLCWPGRKFHARTHYRWLWLSFPLAWTAIDAARAFSGVDVLAGTWGNVAYALYEQAWLLQPLSIFGIFGAELFILIINFALATAVIAALDGASPPEDVPAISMQRALVTLGGVAIAAIGWTALFSRSSSRKPARCASAQCRRTLRLMLRKNFSAASRRRASSASKTPRSSSGAKPGSSSIRFANAPTC